MIVKKQQHKEDFQPIDLIITFSNLRELKLFQDLIGNMSGLNAQEIVKIPSSSGEYSSILQEIWTTLTNNK